MQWVVSVELCWETALLKSVVVTQSNQLVEDISGLLNIIVSDAAILAESVPDPVAYLGALPLCLYKSYQLQKNPQGLVLV